MGHTQTSQIHFHIKGNWSKSTISAKKGEKNLKSVLQHLQKTFLNSLPTISVSLGPGCKRNSGQKLLKESAEVRAWFPKDIEKTVLSKPCTKRAGLLPRLRKDQTTGLQPSPSPLRVQTVLVPPSNSSQGNIQSAEKLKPPSYEVAIIYASRLVI